jgi:hypothetical protein
MRNTPRSIVCTLRSRRDVRRINPWSPIMSKIIAAVIAALALLCACGGGDPEPEQNCGAAVRVCEPIM